MYVFNSYLYNFFLFGIFDKNIRYLEQNTGHKKIEMELNKLKDKTSTIQYNVKLFLITKKAFKKFRCLIRLHQKYFQFLHYL